MDGVRCPFEMSASRVLAIAARPGGSQLGFSSDVEHTEVLVTFCGRQQSTTPKMGYRRIYRVIGVCERNEVCEKRSAASLAPYFTVRTIVPVRYLQSHDVASHVYISGAALAWIHIVVVCRTFSPCYVHKYIEYYCKNPGREKNDQ